MLIFHRPWLVVTMVTVCFDNLYSKTTYKKNEMPLFANKFTPKSIPLRKTETSVLKKEFGSDVANKELSLNIEEVKLKLGEFELVFEDGQWIPGMSRIQCIN